MKKIYALLLGAMLLTPPTLGAEVPAYDGEKQLEAARADIENWQKYLPDDMFVAHVSMPGSHDTATGHNVSLPNFSQAQDVLIDAQLKGGIRAFDFRPGFSKSESGEVTIKCNHGSSSTSLTFDDAFTMLTDYLKEHPTEFFVIHLFRGSPGSDLSTADQEIYNKAVDALFNTGKFADYFVDYDPYLKVKDIRGKMVVFRRDRISWVKINKAGNLSSWPGDQDLWENGAYATASNALKPAIYGKIHVTDVSSPKDESVLNTKLNSITNLYKYNCEQATPNEAKAKGDYEPEWSMIFTSGEYKKSMYGKKGYLTCATNTNPHLTKLINDATAAGTNGPTGIVFTDWVLLDSYEFSGTTYDVKSNDLLKAIIENNFKYAGKYILDDELFKEDDQQEPFEDFFGSGNTYFMRNAATGKFIAAGADWGTHAVMADNGIRFTTYFNEHNGAYLLRTTFRQNGMDNYLGDNAYIDNGSPNLLKPVKAEDGEHYYFTRQSDGKTVALTATPAVNTYADGTTMIVDYADYEKGNKNQEWSLITEDDLVRELVAKATAEAPVDLSFMIHGYKFDPNDDNENNAWVLVPLQDKASTSYVAKTQVWGSNEWNDKDQIYRVYVDRSSVSSTYANNFGWELSQDVTGLPAGTYTVSAQAMLDIVPIEGEEPFVMEANGVDMATGLHREETGTFTCDKGSALDIIRDKSKSLVKAENVSVGEDGKLKLFMSRPTKALAKQNFFFDNFKLMYHGAEGGASVDEVIAADEINAETSVDVYTVAGVQVVKGTRYAAALEGLGRGVYIVRAGDRAIKVMR